MISYKMQPSSSAKIKVLYIAGPTRSGSTIISNILGQIDGYFHAGELCEAWDRGRIWRCSCGVFPDSCPVWANIFRYMDDTVTEKDRQLLIKQRDRFSKSHMVILRRLLMLDNRIILSRIKSLLIGIELLYHKIQQETGAQVIIDSSKNVGYGLILSLIPSFDFHMIHLVRDSRAVAFSWLKKKGGLWTEHPIKTALTWSSRNIAAEILKHDLSEKYYDVRYEDFIKTPKTVVEKIINTCRTRNNRLPFVSSHQVELKVSHGLCGNPGRFNQGRVQLKEDNRWHELELRHKIISTFFTWPLLYRYKYTI